MPTCVECGAHVSNLFTEYSPGNIRLTHCKTCKSTADKYVEHDFIIIFVDMLLHKPQVYRHLLCNRPEGIGGGTRTWDIHPNIKKLAVLLVLFEVYIKWYRLESNAIAQQQSVFLTQSIVYQYLYILLFCAYEFTVFQVAVRWAVYWFVDPRTGRGEDKHPAPSTAVSSHPTSISYPQVTTALIISSFGKMLPILMVIWDYNEQSYAWLISLVVLTSNAEALAAFLRTSYLKTYTLLSISLAVKIACEFIFLKATGNKDLTSLLVGL
ncbi:hypothetical protein BZG36_01892 [Bifiguratus adelaidae]|uniref:Protein ARV n=1 Tax=Bifiguratus adelaidae TaxID=1938954 RepID=A0A261Y4K2_9FUNG|nr:hypothetical protein BZG36_01892 [Bifiguratus adelaidae]